MGGAGSGRPPASTGKERLRRRREYGRAWRAANADRKRSYSLAQFGITVEQYDAMLKRQGGVCAICGRPPKKKRLAVEHDHGPTKRVRGLACHQCNRNKIGANTADSARRVLAYLESDFDGRNL